MASEDARVLLSVTNRSFRSFPVYEKTLSGAGHPIGRGGADVIVRSWAKGVLAISVVLATSSCSDGPVAPVLELHQARALWGEVGPDSYRYTLRRSCFCGPAALGPVRVTVFDGVAVGWRYLDGTTVPEALRPYFPGVLGLFDILEEAYDEDAHSVEVTYDDETGAPLSFFIDYRFEVADEEMGLSIEELPEPIG
jgi:hypothetical protein